LLGGDAIGAAIDLESELDDTASVRIGMEQTGYTHSNGLPENGYYGSVALHPTQDLSVMAGGSLDQSDGKFPFYQDLTNVYVLRENNDATLHSASLDAAYHAGNGTLLKLITNYFSAERGSPGVATTPFRGATSLDERLADGQSLATLKLEQEDENWSGSLAAQYQNQFESFRGTNEGLGDTATNVLYGLMASANSSLKEWLKGYVGIDYVHSDLIGSNITRSNASSIIGRDKINSYVAASIVPTPAFRIAAAVRSEYVSDISNFQWLPQATVEYAPWNEVLLSAAYGRNFQAPTLNDLYWVGLGNPNLKPEQANNGQAAVQYTPSIFGVLADLSATYFYTHAQNEILWLPPANGGANWRPFNVGMAESKGWELRVSGSIPIERRITLDLEENYTLLSAKNITPHDSDEGRELLYSSPVRSLFIARIEREGWGSLAVNAQYRGHKFTDAANTPGGELPPVMTYDLNATTRDFSIAGIGLHLLFGVENLTDKNYQEAIDYPLPGRTYKFSIELHYH
jgi:outer membrane receptor protein involved in Fe transport